MRPLVLALVASSVIAAGCGESESDVGGNPADSPEHAKQPSKEREPKTYPARVKVCLGEAGYETTDAGDTIRVEGPGGSLIADVALSARGIAVWLEDVEDDDKTKVRACLEK